LINSLFSNFFPLIKDIEKKHLKLKEKYLTNLSYFNALSVFVGKPNGKNRRKNGLSVLLWLLGSQVKALCPTHDGVSEKFLKRK